jgi:hypothetical protein
MSRFTNVVALATGVALVATAAATGSAAVPTPAHDAFADASLQTGASWLAVLSNAGATTQTGEAVATRDATTTRQASVWLSFVAEATTSVTVSASSGKTKDIGLAVFSGADLAAATELGFDAGAVTVDVTEGETYSVQVSSIGAPDAAATGTVEVALAAAADAPAADPQKDQSEPVAPPTLALAPGNDSFSSALTVTGAGWTAATNSTEATLESKELRTIPGTSYVIHNSTWLKWKAPASGTVAITTSADPGIDTTLALFTGSTLKTAKRVAVNDDIIVSERTSRLFSIPVKKNTVYRLQVGLSAPSFGTPTAGLIYLKLRGDWVGAPANDSASKPVKKTGESWSVAVSDIGASVEPSWEPTDNPDFTSFPVRTSLWYKWTATSKGTATIAANSSNADSYVAIWRYSTNAGMERVDFEDSSSPLSTGSFGAGTVFYFQLGTLSTNTDSATPGKLTADFAATYTGPEITKITPTSGTKSGSTKVTITGKRFTDATSVTFGGSSALSYSVVSATKIVAYPAPHAKGKVEVKVTTPSGSSREGKTFYTYK